MPIIKHIPIYAAPKRMLAYVTNEEKTEDTLVTGLNCSTKYNDAYEDMKFNFEMYSGERFFKRSIKSDTAKRERQKIRLHHYIQSFKPGEVTPEEAHQIGVEWAEKVFGKKHMVLCATHTDRGHIHNHFAVCPYDMYGKHWYANKKSMKNHGNRFGIDKYDEVTGKNEKSKDTKKNADRHSEAPDKKQGSNKVGSSHKLQQEKQEYAKTQRAKEIRGKQKEIFIKENRKISNTLYSAASGKSQIFRRIFAKKGASLIVGGGVGAVVIPIFLVIIVFILMLAFFGWLSPFSYGLAGEDPDTEHNAETKAEVIDGYALMVKNYMDVTQAYYYLNYGDWYGGTYQYESAELDFASFFADYCESIVAEIQAYYQPLIDQASSPAQAMAISRAMSEATHNQRLCFRRPNPTQSSFLCFADNASVPVIIATSVFFSVSALSIQCCFVTALAFSCASRILFLYLLTTIFIISSEVKQFVFRSKQMPLVHFSLLDNLALFTDVPCFIQDFLLGTPMLTFLVIKHISGGNLFDWFIQKLTLCKYQMNVVIGLSPVMMQC